MATAHGHRPGVRRWVLLVGLPAVVLLVARLMLQSYTSAAARECHALYRAARTAADTARVDSTITPGSRSQDEPHSCGFLRTSARWQ